MIDTKALRSRVLDLAIQGKLTEQLAEDGTAEKLFAQIQAEKQRLIKEGKLKKEKPLPEIKPEEVPFAIPRNWKWVRLSEICRQITDGTHKTPQYQEAGIPFLSVKNISSGVIDFTDIKHISNAEHSELIKRCNPKRNDILICRIGTLGKAIVIDTDTEFSIFVSLGLIKPSSMMLPQYIVDTINSGYGVNWIQVHKAGNSMHADKINLTDLCLITIPLPPLAEQKRIVARVEEIFRLLDTIDAAQQQYAADAESLKAKLITLGIQGRLTEQLASDGTAEELYQQIQAEKQRLIKEGKLKKEKPLPEIKPEEVPFEIPGNWKWTYLGELFQHNTGKALNSANTAGTLLEYITTSNVYWDRFELKSLKQMRFTDDEIDKCTVTKGDLLICEGGDIGRSAIWCYDYDIRIQNHLHRLRGYVSDISAKYYYYLMWLYKATGKIDGRGIGLQGFSSKRVHSLIVPLPPLSEQKRIAETLERVLGVL